MDKIRYNKDNVYRIEVNDNGEYIEFDLLDVSLPIKCINASEKFEEETKKYTEEMKILFDKYKDENISENLTYLREMTKLNESFCLKCREIFDSFLGKGACQKIFGDTNRVGMFDEFFSQLQPHLENMIKNIDEIKEELLNRYKDNNGVM